MALPARKKWVTPLGSATIDIEADGWNACLDEIAKLGPLFTHADPGEVELLRAQLAKADNMLKIREEQNEEFGKLIEEQHAKLAERDALLQDLLDYDISANARRRIEEALSIIAELKVKS